MGATLATNDEELVRRTRTGDLDAFGTLTERYRDVVYRVAARIVGPSDAEDVAQDAMLRAFHRLDQFRADAPFRSWLLRVTQNTALNALERRRTIPTDEAERLAEQRSLDGEIPRQQLPVSDLLDAERKDRMRLKISQLREQHREVLVMRKLGEMSYEEIAGLTGTPLGSPTPADSKAPSTMRTVRSP